jgi:hypothetical protein
MSGEKMNEIIVLTKKDKYEWAYQDYLKEKERLREIIRDLPWVRE